MDANLHHPHCNPPGIWSSQKTAWDLLEILGRYGFRITSPRGLPTFYSTKGVGYTIDLNFCNFLAAQSIQSVEITEDTHGSAYQALEISLALWVEINQTRWTKPKCKSICPAVACQKITPLVDCVQSSVYSSNNAHVQALMTGLEDIQDRFGKVLKANLQRIKP